MHPWLLGLLIFAVTTVALAVVFNASTITILVAIVVVALFIPLMLVVTGNARLVPDTLDKIRALFERQ